MAIVTEPALEGLSGMVGKALVFRMLNGKTIVQSAPVRKAPFNEKQQLYQRRFSEAMAYARNLFTNPQVKAEYDKRARLKGGNCNAYNVAVAEYFSEHSSKHLPV